MDVSSHESELWGGLRKQQTGVARLPSTLCQRGRRRASGCGRLVHLVSGKKINRSLYPSARFLRACVRHCLASAWVARLKGWDLVAIDSMFVGTLRPG